MARRLPVRRVGRWRRLPPSGLAAWGHTHCFLGTPLVDPGWPLDGLRVLVERLRGERRAAFLAIDCLGAGGPVAGALHQALALERTGAVTYHSVERAILRRRDEPTYLAEGLSSGRRKELRRLRRGLAREVGAELAVVDRAGDPLAYDAFLDLEAAGWKGGAGTALACSPGQAAFFRAMCAAFDRLGGLQLLALEADGRPLAMQCNLLDGEALFAFKVAYDERLARYSPGVQLELDAIEVFHGATSAAWMDSCAAPENALINRLWPDRRAVETVLVPSSGSLGRATRPGMAGVRASAALARRGRAPRSPEGEGWRPGVRAGALPRSGVAAD